MSDGAVHCRRYLADGKAVQDLLREWDGVFFPPCSNVILRRLQVGIIL